MFETNASFVSNRTANALCLKNVQNVRDDAAKNIAKPSGGSTHILSRNQCLQVGKL